jgi:hypothetical protein
VTRSPKAQGRAEDVIVAERGAAADHLVFTQQPGDATAGKPSARR